jgi:hypothetical protein
MFLARKIGISAVTPVMANLHRRAASGTITRWLG